MEEEILRGKWEEKKKIEAEFCREKIKGLAVARVRLEWEASEKYTIIVAQAEVQRESSKNEMTKIARKCEITETKNQFE